MERIGSYYKKKSLIFTEYGHSTDRQTHTRTSQLLDQLGPEGRVGEKTKPSDEV